jgi:hypothetical protein
MYQFILILIFSLCFISCQTKQDEKPIKTVESRINAVPKPTIEKEKEERKEILETFSNENKIGIPGKNKIELSNFGTSDESIVEVKFYSLNKNKSWKLKQSIKIEKFGGMPLQTDLSDFNNDGFKDLTFISESPARGANELRKLFIYDKKKDELIHIINSDEHPNLEYNKKLDCLTTMRYYGGFSTEFLKIDGNELKEFASVETMGDVRKVYLTDKNGERKLMRTDKINPQDGFIRYDTFDPPS